MRFPSRSSLRDLVLLPSFLSPPFTNEKTELGEVKRMPRVPQVCRLPLQHSLGDIMLPVISFCHICK